jgi:hypothetical protein
MGGKNVTTGNTPYVYRYGTAPNTSLVNTLKVKVFSFDDSTESVPIMVQIGVLQEWTPSDSRTNTAVRSIGYGDQIAEINPGSTELTGSASVMALYTRNIMQVFGYVAGISGLVRSLKHHRWPFDIREEIVLPLFIQGGIGSAVGATSQASLGDSTRVTEANKTKAIVTYYEGCWMNSYSRSYTIGDVSVSESSDIMVTDVYDPFELNQYGEGLQGGNGAANVGQSRLFLNKEQIRTDQGTPFPGS